MKKILHFQFSSKKSFNAIESLMRSIPLNKAVELIKECNPSANLRNSQKKFDEVWKIVGQLQEAQVDTEGISQVHSEVFKKY